MVDRYANIEVVGISSTRYITPPTKGMINEARVSCDVAAKSYVRKHGTVQGYVFRQRVDSPVLLNERMVPGGPPFTTEALFTCHGSWIQIVYTKK